MHGSRRKWWRWAAAAAAVLALVAVICQGGARTQVRLPDGSLVRLRAVTYGTQHYGPPRWLNWLLHRLPVWRLARSGLNPPVWLTTAKPEVVLWLEHRRATNAASGLWFSVADGDGVEAGVDALADQHTPLLPGLPIDQATTTFFVTVYPRRQTRLRLNVYDATRTHWLGSLAFGVPAVGPYPVWTPEPLPAERRFDDCELALSELTVHMLPPDSGVDEKKAWIGLANARLRTSGEKEPCKGWRVARLVLEDATGNRVESLDVADRRTVLGEGDPAAQADLPSARPWVLPFGLELRRRSRDAFAAETAALFLTPRSSGLMPQRFHVSERAGDDEVLTFRWPLWHRETAYKLSVELVPRVDAEFKPGRKLCLTGIRVPTPDTLSPVGVRTNLSGHELEVLALVGENATLPGREKDVHGQTTLELKVAALPDDLQFAVVSLADEHGRLAEPGMVVPRESYGYSIPTEAQTVDIVLAIFPRRRAAFLVRPTFEW